MKSYLGTTAIGRNLRGAAAALLACIAGTQASAQTDRINDTRTSWWYYYSLDEADINTQIAAGARPFSICRNSSTSYDTLFVNNAGEYAATGGTIRRGYTSATTLNNFLSTNQLRILDLEAYDAGGGVTGYDVITVANTGATAATGWSWTTSTSWNGIISWQENNDLRIIDIDSYVVNGQRRFSAVAVPNTGNNAQSWWWYLNQTESQVTAMLTQNGARLIDIDIESVGTVGNPEVRYNVVMVGENPGMGVWAPNLTSSQVADLYANNGGRLTILQRYTTASGATRYVAAAVDNLTTEGRRIRNLITNGTPSGYRGFARKRIGGSMELALNEAHEFDPASTMKIVHGAYAVDRMASGVSNMSTQIFCADNCGNTGDCPDTSPNCQAGNRSISSLMTVMFNGSDNNATHAIEDYYGRVNLNNWLAGQGLGIRINHTLGCLCGNTPNEMTCADVVALYENIFDGTLFNQSWQDELKTRMIYRNGTGIGGALRTILDQERANTSLTSLEYNDFLNAFELAFKDGGYSCSDIRSGGAAGWAKIPFRGKLGNAVITSNREYAIAMLAGEVQGATQMNNVYPQFYELLREPIRDALESWDAICTLPNVSSVADVDSISVGGSASFTTSVGGTPSTYNFIWRKSVNGVWTAVSNQSGHISGANTATLSFTNAVVGDAGNYKLWVESDCGVDSSETMQLIVTNNCTPATVTNPVAQSVTSGEDATFSVVAGGSSSGRTYLWQRLAPSGLIWTSLSGNLGFSGATTATLTVLDATTADEGSYRCRVTNGCGEDTSLGATLTVNAACVAPTIASQPQSVQVIQGEDGVFTLSANGSSAGRTYNWQKRSGLNVWTNLIDTRGTVGGSSTRTLTVYDVSQADEGSYRCQVTNDCGHVTSNIVTLTAIIIPTCGDSDFNGDGDFGTDADIEAFFACLAGNCCPTCYEGGADFNADGDTGTDADIESFFRVLAGGAC